jgi:hypothetical protein
MTPFSCLDLCPSTYIALDMGFVLFFLCLQAIPSAASSHLGPTNNHHQQQQQQAPLLATGLPPSLGQLPPELHTLSTDLRQMRDYLEYLQPQDPSLRHSMSPRRNYLDHLNTSELEFDVPPRNPRSLNWPWNPTMNLSPAAFSLMVPHGELPPNTTSSGSSSTSNSSRDFLTSYFQAINAPQPPPPAQLQQQQQQQRGAWAGHHTPAGFSNQGTKDQGLSPEAIRALVALVLLPVIAPHFAAWLKQIAAVFDVMVHYMSQNPDPLL